jgi:hypothetical protein
MSMIKQNVVEGKRTPAHEIARHDANWDKYAAAEFKPVKDTPKKQPTKKQVNQ